MPRKYIDVISSAGLCNLRNGWYQTIVNITVGLQWTYFIDYYLSLIVIVTTWREYKPRDRYMDHIYVRLVTQIHWVHCAKELHSL